MMSKVCHVFFLYFYLFCISTWIKYTSSQCTTMASTTALEMIAKNTAVSASVSIPACITPNVASYASLSFSASGDLDASYIEYLTVHVAGENVGDCKVTKYCSSTPEPCLAKYNLPLNSSSVMVSMTPSADVGLYCKQPATLFVVANVHCCPYSSVPSSQPSSQPTSRPSANCPDGYEAFGNNCTACAAGSYSNEITKRCLLCPNNTYQSEVGQMTCKSCGLMYQSQKGSTSETDCDNFYVSMALGLLFFFLAMFVVLLYIYGGFFQYVAYWKHLRVVNPCIQLYSCVFYINDVVAAAYHSWTLQQFQSRQHWIFRYSEQTRSWIFYGSVCLLIPMMVMASMFQIVIRVLFNALLLWRGYVASIPIPDLFMRNVDRMMTLMVEYKYFVLVRYLVYPFLALFDVLSNINVNFRGVGVTCEGSQSLMFFWINIFIAGIVIIWIKSEFHLFWTSCLQALCQNSMISLLQRYVLQMELKDSVIQSCIAAAVLMLPTPNKVIQYSLGFASFSRFVPTNPIPNGVNCPLIDPLLGGFSTFASIWCIFPIIFMIAQVLVQKFTPQFLPFDSPRLLILPDEVSVGNGIDNNHVEKAKMEGPGGDGNVVDKIIVEQPGKDGVDKDAPDKIKPESPNGEDDSCEKSCESSCENCVMNVFSFYSLCTSIDQFCLEGCRSYATYVYKSQQNVLKEMSAMSHKEQNIIVEDAVDKRMIELSKGSALITKKEFSVDEEKQFPLTYMRFSMSMYDVDESSDGSYLFIVAPLPQLLQSKGRAFFYRMIRNYIVFACISIGWWTDEFLDDFQLLENYEKFTALMAVDTTKSNEEEENKVEDANKNDREVTETQNKSSLLEYLSCQVMVRVVLIQLFPFLTLWSVFAVEIAGCPIFVFSEKLAKLLPPFIVWDAFESARKRLSSPLSSEAQSQIQPRNTEGQDVQSNAVEVASWKVDILAVYIIMTESRLVRFSIALINLLVSINLIYGTYVEVGFYALLVISVLEGFITACYYTILLHKFIFPIVAVGKALEMGVTKLDAFGNNGANDIEMQDIIKVGGNSIEIGTEGSIVQTSVKMKPLTPSKVLPFAEE